MKIKRVGTIHDRRTKAYKKWLHGCAFAAENNLYFALRRLQDENKQLKQQLNEKNFHNT